MFEIDIESQFRAISFYDSERQIRFDPPVYEQRYSTVIRILELERWTKHLKKVVEFGCAEMRMLFQMKTIPSIQHIVEVRPILLLCFKRIQFNVYTEVPFV